MSQKYLTKSAFFNWKGWDYLKWPFGMLILSFVLWALSANSSATRFQEQMNHAPEEIKAVYITLDDLSRRPAPISSIMTEKEK